jgi:protein-S-isoprenylcysteine O-methyltransferase Ste14
MAAWRQLRAIVLLPGVVFGVIPGLIVYFTGLDTFCIGWFCPVTRIILPIIGLSFAAVGLSVMIAAIRLFATVGKGTLAPWDPPSRFVAQGVYRHVRNPMISGGLVVLLSEAVLAASLPLLCWFVFVFMVNAVYFPLVEEPGLARRFGEDYLVYKRNVPRWIPRWSPWQQE